MLKYIISAITKIAPAFSLGVMVSRIANEISNTGNVSGVKLTVCFILIQIIGYSIAYDILSRREEESRFINGSN